MDCDWGTFTFFLQIYPEESQLTAIEKLVSVTEKALKAVSDSLAQEYVFSFFKY